MELKHWEITDEGDTLTLLIVPYGIETMDHERDDEYLRNF